MTQRPAARGRAVSVLLWILTVFVALGIGAAGVTKFTGATQWRDSFTGWGYPAWFASVIGMAEVTGAIGLLIPRTTVYAAACLMAVMVGALGTLLVHPGGRMGWGATPLVYIVLLAVVVAIRWRERAGATAR